MWINNSTFLDENDKTWRKNFQRYGANCNEITIGCRLDTVVRFLQLTATFLQLLLLPARIKISPANLSRWFRCVWISRSQWPSKDRLSWWPSYMQTNENTELLLEFILKGKWFNKDCTSQVRIWAKNCLNQKNELVYSLTGSLVTANGSSTLTWLALAIKTSFFGLSWAPVGFFSMVLTTS